MQSELQKCGERLVVELPSELLSALGWSVGDILNIERLDNGLKVDRTMTARDHTMEIARSVMNEYSETLTDLAKS
jgi:antitoxin component of MazEF toxin-antitoxin module